MECEYCSSKKVVKHGKRYSKQRGGVQRYTCKDCGRRFVRRVKTYRMKHRRFFLDYALQLRKEGLSLSQISERVGTVSRQAVFYWVKKFMKDDKGKLEGVSSLDLGDK
ncbi:MAG: helix-turn-helix domain-containing protein [Candidatus Paceibacterota bacterium]